MVLNSLMLAGGDFKSFVMAMACYRIGQQDKGRLNLLVLKHFDRLAIFAAIRRASSRVSIKPLSEPPVNRSQQFARLPKELSKKDNRTMSTWIELALRRAIEEAKRKK